MINSPVTNQQKAYEHIREQIMNLGFKPGEYITDTQIASRLSISRTPVREAFHRLEKEGLLINDPRRGWRIYTLTLEDINEIFDLKGVIEGMVARKAAQCQDAQLRDSLRAMLRRMEEADGANDASAWLKADIELHGILYRMAGNERAQEIVENLNVQWHRVRIGFVALQGRTRRSSSEHRAFIESILAGNGEEAEMRMRAHLDQVREELVHLLITVVLPFVEAGV
jgi:DNA-binding GntR family transcriptional regulator